MATYTSRVVPEAFILTILLGVLTRPLQAQEQGPATVHVVRSFGAEDTRRFLFSPEVVADAADGTIRLAHSTLLADEMGATDFHQTEPLGERTWAKKAFVLDDADMSSAEVFLFGNARRIRVNGQAVQGEKLYSTGWTRARIPPALLTIGENEIVLAGGGNLLVEPSRQPGRSFKSTDGGRTWSRERLGGKNQGQGEYLVRLRLGRYAAQGSALSPVLDLWTNRADDVAIPGRTVAFSSLAALGQKQPEGTRIVSWLRTGSTPTPEVKTWTDWIALGRDHQPAGATATHRWAQLRFELSSGRSQATPRLPARFDWAFEFQPDTAANRDRLRVDGSKSPEIRVSAVPFFYQETSPRLKLLRERYRLDEVIAAGATEMEQLMLLRHWVRNQWHTAWGSNTAAWMPPWDALMILESKDQPDCLTMCTHYAAVFTQCCLALGWTARHCILDHHCVAEVWVNQHHKWVMMDPGNSKERPDANLHFERKGVPQSALELQQALRSGQTMDITVHFTPARLMGKIAALCRPAPESGKVPPRPDVIPLAELASYPVCQLVNYRRYAFPARNNYLDTLFPGELYQGWSSYFYDGYCWVGDTPDDPRTAPEYSHHLAPTRPQDIDWSVNWTRLHLARTTKPGELQVQLETLTPNLARFEQRVEGSSWKPTPAVFVWQLKPGQNELRVRSVNRFERAGVEARVRVERIRKEP